MSEPRRYQLLGTLGKGGFGTVYKANLLGAGGFTKIVALKVMNAELEGQEELARRTRDEARILGLVRHRAIVQVDGLVRLEGRWTIVMEYVSGVDLKKVVEAGPMPPAAALEVVEETARALEAAWAQKGPDGHPLELLHRDIKPSNILLTERGEVKVLDFGTARANFSSREAVTGAMAFGTVLYMSPERMAFDDLPAGDVYALGAVLFELLLGEALGRASPQPERHAALLQSARERLERAALPPPLVALVLRLVAYDPAQRPPMAEVDNLCRALRSQVPGPWLNDWADQTMPRLLLGASRTRIDQEAGTTLTEDVGTSAVLLRPTTTPIPRPAPPGPGAPRPASGRWLVVLVVLGLLGGGCCGLGALVAWLRWDRLSALLSGSL